MAYCVKCGGQIDEQASFCSKCGAQQKGVGSAPSTVGGAVPAPGLAENVAALLCYAFFWVGGVIFFFIDRRPFVRFHAAQSVVVFAGLHVIRGLLGILIAARVMHGDWFALWPGHLLLHVVDVFGVILWIVLMVKAFQGEWFKVPVAWELAEGIGGAVPADKR
jgi:uncharacterized membrane protein